jgi:hypothetical protein
MDKHKNTTSSGTETVPSIDALKPIRMETATFALG